jgi:hypothetical protein
MPLQIRRGTEQERQSLSSPLALGEPLWVSDTHQLFVGDGTTATNMLSSITSYASSGGSFVGELKGSVYADDSSLLVDSVGAKLLGTHDGILNGSVNTSDGLTTIINGSNGYITTSQITATQQYSTTVQLGSTVSPTGSATIYNESNPFLKLYSTTANTNPIITFNASNGTSASPTAIVAGDLLGGLSFNGYTSGSTYGPSVVLSAVADADVANNSLPGRFLVTATSTNGLSTKTLSFDSSGNLTATKFIGDLVGNASSATIGIGTRVYDDAADRDASIMPGDLTIGMLAMLLDDGFGESVTQHYTSNGWDTFSGVRFTNSHELSQLVSDATGTGISNVGLAVFNDSPVLITPDLGVATATSLNNITFTTPINPATFTLASGSTLATIGAHSTTLTVTATTALTLPVSGTVLSTDSSVDSDKLTGTIPSTVLGNSSVYIGTTDVALNRATGMLTVADLNTDGYAGGLKTSSGSVSVSASAAPTVNQVLVATSGTVAAWATPNLASFTGTITMAQASAAIVGRPVLLLDFANAKSLDSRITFTRATSATYYDSNGTLKTATLGEPRFDHDPVTGYPLGLLIEEQRVNLLNFSQSFLTTGGAQNNWVDATMTRTSTTNLAPDGTATALLLTAAAANATMKSTAVAGSSAERTFSVFLKRSVGTGDFEYTLDNGTTWIAQAITTSWARYTFPATTANQQVGFRIALSGNAIFVWGAQLEAGSFATSYIKTTTSTATRDADNAVITGTNFSSWYNQSEGTILAKVDSLYSSSSATEQTIVALNDGTTNNYQRITRVNATSRFYVKNTTTDVDLSGNAFTTGTSAIAVSYKLNDFSYTSDGIVAITDTTSVVPTETAMSIGSWLGTNTYLNGHILKLAYFAKRISDANNQAITTV